VARLYCLVTVPAEGPAAATANLRAPLVVNPANWRATQVVLLDGSHPIRRPLRR
jgi:flagellar assembly factor FliW